MEKILFLGSSRLAQICLRTLLSSQTYQLTFELPAIGSSKGFFEKAVGNLPGLESCSFVDVDERDERLVLDAINQLGISLIFSVQHPWIFSGAVLDAVDGRSINLHNARLPDYRGHNSISHVILNQDKEHHATLHWMAESVDRGRPIGSASVPVDDEDTAMSLYLRSLGAVKELAESFREYLECGKIPAGKPQSGEGAYYSKGSLEALRDVGLAKEKTEVQRVARALFFPPHEPAYFRRGAAKEYVIPEGARDFWKKPDPPANQPVW